MVYSSENTVNPVAYRAIIFNSARDGNLMRLKIFLEDRSAEWLRDCFASSVTSTPPIVIAARNGHYDVVKYLLKKGANIKVTGLVSFDGEVISGASALWAAAAAGHLSVTRHLIEEGGADINQTTQSRSSPLRGACYDGHLDVVKYLIEKGADIELANRHGHTPLMIAAFKMRTEIVQLLLDSGADPCRASLKGNTALHNAAESGSTEIVNMLLNAGAQNFADETGVTPIQCSALAGHKDTLYSLAAVSTAQETRDALKLYGATLVDKKMDLSGALRVWSEAVRYGGQIEAITAFSVYDYMFEVDSQEDIRNVVGDPDAIRMQALIMRERILGGGHNETHYFIRYRGAVYCDLGQVSRCFQLWMHALDLQQKHLCALHPSTVSTIGAFVDTFIVTINEGIINANVDGIRMAPLCRSDVLCVLSRSVFELERFDNGDHRIKSDDILDESDDETKCLNFLMLSALQLILLIKRLSSVEIMSVSEYELSVVDDHFDILFRNSILRFVTVCKSLKLYPLHAACLDVNKPVTTRFPCGCVIMMLIHAGVDVNSKNDLGHTPLHTLLLGGKPRLSIVKLLLDDGALLLARSPEDQTCLELISNKMPNAVVQLKLGRYMNLLGLAANVLHRNGHFESVKKVIPLDLLPELQLY